MLMDVTFFENYLAIFQTDFVNDHSHTMGLERKFVSSLLFFVDLGKDCFSGLLWLFDSLYDSFCIAETRVNVDFVTI